MKFLGIDLGWSSSPSGLCCLEFQNGSLSLQDLRREDSISAKRSSEHTSDILNWIDNCVPDNQAGIIAVDAPTLIPNQTGMRLPDRLAHQYFGRYHAGCYPANLHRPFAARTVGFGLSLEARGFHHAPTIEPQKPGRYQIEVFPHPAMIHLFGLNQILKYKKGTLAERRSELAKLRQYILEILPTLDPSLRLDSLPEIPLKGTELKALEDQLDSLICAYVAAHWWVWGVDRNWVLGDRQEGYIVVPNPFRVLPT
jgi:predicted RNase H-like nuclease